MKNIHRWIFFVFSSFLAILLSFSPANGQSSPVMATIVDVDDSTFPLIHAYLSVSDSLGLPITDLDTTLFHVSEDGKPVQNLNVTSIRNEEQALAIVLVIDTSGSMGGTPIVNSIDAATKFVETLTPNDQLAIITFADEVQLKSELTPDHAQSIEVLNGFETKGNTALYDGLIDGIHVLKDRPERKVVVLLTDGKDSGVSTFGFDDVINEARTWSTPIYPIGFGSVDTNELEKFAKLTGGVSQVNSDSSVIASAFENVLDSLRNQYLVEFSSSFPADGMEHDLSISADYSGTLLTASRKFIASPSTILITLPDIPADSNISGLVKIAPDIVTPAPITSLEILIDDQPQTRLVVAPFEFVWDSGSVEPGTHTLAINALDIVGNTGLLSQSIEVIPAVSIMPSLTEGQLVRGKVTLSSSIDAPAGVQLVEYLIDDQKIGESTASPFEVIWDSSTISPGFHKLTTRATDLLGYTSELATQINIDMQRSSNLIWISGILLLAAAAIILPIAFRRNRLKKIGGRMTGPGKDSGRVTFPVKLTEQAGINFGTTWPITKEETRLGRKKDENDIPLKGLTASRNQAVIRHVAQGYILYSMNPENPTLINGAPVVEQLLYNGDVIESGESKFTFEIQA